MTLAGVNLVQNEQTIELQSVYSPLFRFSKDEVTSHLEVNFGSFHTIIFFFALFPFVQVIVPEGKLPSQAKMNRLQREYLNTSREKSRMKSR